MILLKGQLPYIVTGIVMKNGNNKDDGFDNGYFKDPDGNNETPHELFVQKEVTGAMGNKSEEFAFTIKIDGAEGEKYYAVVEEWQTVEGVGTVGAAGESGQELRH